MTLWFRRVRSVSHFASWWKNRRPRRCNRAKKMASERSERHDRTVYRYRRPDRTLTCWTMILTLKQADKGQFHRHKLSIRFCFGNIAPPCQFETRAAAPLEDKHIERRWYLFLLLYDLLYTPPVCFTAHEFAHANTRSARCLYCTN